MAWAALDPLLYSAECGHLVEWEPATACLPQLVAPWEAERYVVVLCGVQVELS